MSEVRSTNMLKQIHSARGEFYAFLSRIFSNIPDNEMYQMISEVAPKLKMLSENTNSEDIKAGIDGIINFLEKRNSLSGKELLDFDLERSRHYTLLFCLPKASIPTDESNYTSFNHESRGKSYDSVLELFGRYKMVKTGIPENEDSIGYELLFMSRLAYYCVDFIQEGNIEDYKDRLKAQQDFHTDHLDKWVYDFFARVISAGIPNEMFYKYAACFAAGFLKEDKLTIDELLA